MSIVAGLLNQTIDSIKSVTIDGYGDTTAVTLYTYQPCRWQESVKQTTDSTNEEVTSTVEMWLFPDITIKENYQVVKDGVTYKVINVSKKYDIDGVHDFTKVLLV